MNICTDIVEMQQAKQKLNDSQLAMKASISRQTLCVVKKCGRCKPSPPEDCPGAGRAGGKHHQERGEQRMRDFYQTFFQLCESKGIAPSKVAQEIGLNKSSVSYWKKGSIPKMDTLKALAQYFNVTVDYLTGLDDLEATIVQEVSAPRRAGTAEAHRLPYGAVHHRGHRGGVCACTAANR